MLSDRSILSFAGDEIGSSGRFTIRDGEGSAFLSRHTIPPLTGRYWKTAGGNVYTDLDVDSGLIDSVPVLEIVMTPDNEIADPPETANPYGLLTTMGSYVATISHCGKLPHVQTEFFESDYTGPDERGYIGPHFFASGWACEDPLADN